MIPFCDMLQVNMELLDGKFDSAKLKFEECLTSAQLSEIKSFCLAKLADITVWPASEWQYQWPLIYFAHAHNLKDKLELHKALLFLGDIFVVKADEDTATSLYQVALTGFIHMGIHQSQAQCMLRLGDLANKRGCTSEAITLWKGAQPLFERSLQEKDVALINTKILNVEKAHDKALVQLETLHAPVHAINKDVSETEGEEAPEGAEEYLVPVLV
ncbi:hypothetical protein K438DRAFT_200759 [Mycena galopus ATCC 62051]|nr:hypothetical protein K438DRAFT_200759 [Mycena galopus ATCC 62051]